MSEVEHPGKHRPWFRRRWFRGVFVLTALPLVLFCLSNLWLTLPPGRSWIAGKISARVGLEADIERASWSPWDGVRLNGLQILQPPKLRSSIPEPLFRAASVQVWPKWDAWLQKRVEVHSIEIDSPRAVIPIELLAHLAGPPPLVPTTPALVAADAPPVPTPPPGPAMAAAAPPPVAIPAPPASIPSAPVPSALPTSPSQPTGWIHVRHGSIAIVSAAHSRPLIEAEEFEADIPAAGNPAESQASLGRITALGHEVIGKVACPLYWRSPIIQLGPASGEFNGAPWQWMAKLALSEKLPIATELNFPPKENARIPLPGDSFVSARAFRSFGRFAGLLITPSSWQGEFAAEGKGLSIHIPSRPPMNFDQGVAIVTLRGGQLSCPDARLIGDDLSLLGNATIVSDSRTAAVLRIVAGQEAAQQVANGIGHATGKRMAFGMLGTPDRFASDLYALGNIDGINIQLGQGGDVIDGPTLLALLKARTTASQ